MPLGSSRKVTRHGDRPNPYYRGLADASPEEHRAISALGGRACPAHKRSFSYDFEHAQRAGRLGGLKRKA